MSTKKQPISLVRNNSKHLHKGREQAVKLTKTLSLLKNSRHSTKKPSFVFFRLPHLLIESLFFMAWS